MKADLRKAGESTAFLVFREEYRAEFRISIFRVAFVLLLLVSNLIQAILLDRNLLTAVLPLAVLMLLAVFMLIDIWWMGRSRYFSRFYRPSHKYLIITLDVIGFSVMLFLAFTNPELRNLMDNSGIATGILLAIGFLGLFGLYIILDLLRFSAGSSFFALLVFSLGYGLLYYLVPLNAGQVFQLGDALVHASVFFFPAFIMTLLSAYVSRRVADLVLQSKIQQQLERYLPPALTRENMSRGSVRLDDSQGHRGTAAVLFADIRRFTSLSENMSPQEVVDFLNSYFNDMIEVVFSNKGTLDKIVGDEIMALFGTPVEDDQFCDNAVITALDMIDKLEGFNELRALQGVEPVGIGIGIHQGEVIVGSIGSQKRMDFTAIGDTVNTASRLERLTRKLDSHIIISESVKQNLSRKLLRSLSLEDYGLASVRGKVERFRIYGLSRR